MKKNQKSPKIMKRWNGYLISIAVITIGIALALSVSWVLNQKPKAVIIDQLGHTYPNSALIKSITKDFNQAGVKVDYIPPEEVTVDFYRALSTGRYKYIVLRAHTCLFRDEPGSDDLTLSTNEPYTTLKYRDEQTRGRLAWLNIPGDNTKYFGVSSSFVESSMVGNFNDAVLIMMGCNGLTFSRMAKAFVQKGVQSVVGWDEMVSLNHTDKATELLVSIILKGQTDFKETVKKVMEQIGKDPDYGSKLLVYQ